MAMVARSARKPQGERPRTDRRGSDAALLSRLETLASLMDSRFVVPGTNIRFGLDAILSIVPVAGDFAGMAVSAYLIWEAWRIGAPKGLLARMAANAGIDFVVGSIPIAGTIADVFIRANMRNMRLLRDHLASRRTAF